MPGTVVKFFPQNPPIYIMKELLCRVTINIFGKYVSGIKTGRNLPGVHPLSGLPVCLRKPIGRPNGSVLISQLVRIIRIRNSGVFQQECCEQNSRSPKMLNGRPPLSAGWDCMNYILMEKKLVIRFSPQD